MGATGGRGFRSLRCGVQSLQRTLPASRPYRWARHRTYLGVRRREKDCRFLKAVSRCWSLGTFGADGEAVLLVGELAAVVDEEALVAGELIRLTRQDAHGQFLTG